MAYINGIDVSILQGNINWQETKTKLGIEFVMCRCGVGNDGIDSNFANYVSGARAAGLYVGAYHFAYPLINDATHKNRDPISQANIHYAAASAQNVSVVALDVEWPTNNDWAAWNINANSIKQWLLTYLQTYTQLNGGIQPIIYIYPDYCNQIDIAASPEFAQFKLWIASYNQTPTIPAPFTDFVMWQTSGGTGPNAAHLPNGAPVDTDVIKDLSLWQSPPSTVVSVPITLPPTSTDPIATVPTQPITSTLTQTNSVNWFQAILNFLSDLLNFLKK